MQTSLCKATAPLIFSLQTSHTHTHTHTVQTRTHFLLVSCRPHTHTHTQYKHAHIFYWFHADLFVQNHSTANIQPAESESSSFTTPASSTLRLRLLSSQLRQISRSWWTRMAYLRVFILIFLISGRLIQAASVDDFPGWMGEIKPHTKDSDLSQVDQIIDPTRIIHLAWKPRAFLYKGFLSNKECEHLIELAKDKLEKSMVADNESGKGVLSEIRTSSGMFIDKGHDEIVRRIEKRIATWTFLPEENGEAFQVLKYQRGEKYEPHYDFFQDKINVQLGGHRIATVLMYLSNVTKGGETVFPNVPDHRVKDDTWSDCAKQGLAVKPTKGDALLFFSLSTEAKPDTRSLHGGCPVIEGEKWSATKWIHVDSFDKPRKEVGCVDENVSCAEWAAMGECQKNPTYMVGTERSPGSCRASCNVC